MSCTEILIVCEPSQAGVFRHVDQIVRHLEGSEFHFTIACPADSLLRISLADLPVAFKQAEMHSMRPDRFFLAMISLLKIMWHSRFNVVHIHSSKAGVYGRIIARLYGMKIIYTPHCFSFVSVQSSQCRAWLYLQVERILGRITDILICITESELQLANRKKIIPASRLHLLCNYANEEKYFPMTASFKLRSDIGMSAADKVIVTISRFDIQKAPQDFMRMCMELRRRRPHLHFIFIGSDGPQRQECMEDIKELSIENLLTWVPWTDQLQNYLALADVVVLNSLWEGAPACLLEAMLMAKPFVATNLPGTRDLVSKGDCGILLPVKEPEQMADVVNSLLNNYERRMKMGQTGYLIAKKYYTPEASMRGLRELYLQIAGGA